MRSAPPWKALAASVAVAGLSLVSAPVLGPVASIVPVAQAQECRGLTAGSLDWGIKQSFRNYLAGPIAMGGWELDGAEFHGEEKGGDGAFRFNADTERATLSGDDADIPLSGAVRLHGHFGALNITMSDLEVQIRGTQGQIVGRMGSDSPALLSSVLGFGGGSGERVPLATLSLDQPLSQALASDGTATLTAATRLTEEANQALGGNYGEGNNEGDTATLRLSTAPGEGECAGVDTSVALAQAPGQPAAQPTAPAAPAEPSAPEPQRPATGVTPPTSTECAEVTSASAGWGIKQSFRNYLTGPIALGGWDLNGVEYRGSQGGADGQFAFSSPQGQATVTPEGADIPLAGSLSLHGHLGLLKIELSAMSVKVRGNQAQFIADFTSNTVNRPTAGAKVTGQETGTQAVIAEFTLDSSITQEALASGEVRLSGGGYITAEGNRAFGGNYGEGNNQADPLDVTLAVSGAAECGSGEGLSEYAASTPASSGAQDAGTAPGGQQAAPSAPSGQGRPALDVAAPARGASAPAAPGNTGNNGQGASISNGGTCDEGATRAVSDARLGWGVKDSFRTYVRGPIAHGGWRLSGATESGGAFVFSGSQGAVDTSAARGTISHGGSVTFYGHDGVLNTTIANPEIQFAGGAGTLIAEVTSNDTEGNAVNYGRIAVAELAVNTSVNADVLDGTAAASLTQAGATALGDFYPAGTEMAPVSFKAALSGSASCGAVTGAEAAKSAGTGAKPLSKEDIAALEKNQEQSTETTEAAVPLEMDAARSGSRTSLLDSKQAAPRSAAVALAENPMTPPSLAVMVLGLAGLGVYLLTGRRAAKKTEGDYEA
ncbi:MULTISPECIES: HtaA domain-containing protein [unclassified Corynebacterium]|uniref:HtaA domain-containing protein n=1 Tax=unclassified Corynebacterium TaxID=2624378 RepID=UPI0029C9F8D3|nr:MULTISPECIES: HtaA domain-containing protein [unclassified Corynebacterium]WPF65805.1 HtaA domain-containing protein [Corynebacterium sp. 22KM0430]WPF68298.1 HtaA domain-containing protein [Corynebacterium sp. 21KM1197]